MREPITEGQQRAVVRLNRIEHELGADGTTLVHEVLILGMTMQQVGERRGLSTQRWTDYLARRLQECLDRLALFYGFAASARPSKASRAEAQRLHDVIGRLAERDGVVDRQGTKRRGPGQADTDRGTHDVLVSDL